MVFVLTAGLGQPIDSQRYALLRGYIYMEQLSGQQRRH